MEAMMGRLEQMMTTMGALAQQIATTSTETISRLTAEATAARDQAARAEQATREAVARLERLHEMCTQQNQFVESRLQTFEKSGPHGKKGLVDPKAMAPGPIDGDKGRPWKEWSRKAKVYCGCLQGSALQEAMEWAETWPDPITPEKVGERRMDEQMDQHLKAFLEMNTTGRAASAVQLAGRLPGLEAYRLLARELDPRTDTRQFDDANSIMNPPKATSMSDYAIKLPAWRVQYQDRVDRYGPGEKLTDSYRALIMINMLPPKESAEIFKDRDRWTSNLPGLEKHLQQMIHDRTRGPAAMMIGAVDKEGEQDPEEELYEEYNLETDEVEVYKIETKDGRSSKRR